MPPHKAAAPASVPNNRRLPFLPPPYPLAFLLWTAAFRSSSGTTAATGPFAVGPLMIMSEAASLAARLESTVRRTAFQPGCALACVGTTIELCGRW